MLENIGTQAHAAISTPAGIFLSLIEQYKNVHHAITVAEIGVGIGATTVEILKRLNSNDTLYLFDFQDTLDALLHDFEKHALNTAHIPIHAVGNSMLSMDSYSWSLATLALQHKTQGNTQVLFDLAYLDGAHSFVHDAPATAVLKTLIKPGGFILFDDMDWSFAVSPSMNPKVYPATAAMYTQEQIEIPHVKMVVDLLVRPDREWREVPLPQPIAAHQALFQKM